MSSEKPSGEGGARMRPTEYVAPVLVLALAAILFGLAISKAWRRSERSNGDRPSIDPAIAEKFRR